MTINVSINNIDLKLNTNDKLFSPRNADIGTLSMLEEIDFSLGK
ncbi:hypothetical protein [Brachyspira alvinipulli]|nr:hypothetical protein [Brachyspira alvinipulli]